MFNKKHVIIANCILKHNIKNIYKIKKRAKIFLYETFWLKNNIKNKLLSVFILKNKQN